MGPETKKKISKKVKSPVIFLESMIAHVMKVY